MSRRGFEDIPEAFRRAMEREGWTAQNQGGGGDGGEPRPTGPPPEFDPPWRNKWMWVAGVVFLLFTSLNWIVTNYTDWLWFQAVGYDSVWSKQFLLSYGLFFGAWILVSLFLILMWQYARRRASENIMMGIRVLELPGIGWMLNGIAVFFGFMFASAIGPRWDMFLRYWYRVPFGTVDPIFERDISFYLFELPAFRFLHSWLLPLMVITLIGVFVLYAVSNWAMVQQGGWQPTQLPTLRKQVALLATVIFALWAIGYIFNTYELNYSSRGVAFGASYTDLNASLYGIYLQAAAMGLLAIVALLNFFRLSIRPLVVAAAIWLAATFLVANIYPEVVQRFTVEPNELNLEREYIQHNIEYTRLAFGLNEVEPQAFDVGDPLTEADLANEGAALENIRLWDYRPLQTVYSQLQELRPYYQFIDVDIDRYEIDGEIRQVMLSARELETDQLPASSWINEKLIFTHGYGVVMNPVDKFTREGQPEFYISDLPPRSEIDLQIDRPEIYYGEAENGVVYVNSEQAEFDYPVGNSNAETNYAGKGGVLLNNTFRKLMFALRYSDTNVLLSNDLTNESRVLMHRQIQERIKEITPFFTLDGDPYLVAVEGRLVFIQDAYTVSSAFPYSTPREDSNLNYIRNGAKITVDAYDGSIEYYLADETDPIVLTYDRAFPDLFQPLSAMPAELAAHIRYPEDLFRVQTEQYLVYHMEDTNVFFGKEDVWEIPQEIFDGKTQLMEPYYVMFRLPGEEEAEYLLIQPYTPAGKQNMIGWIAARNDPENYGELVVYELPKQSLVFGPLQVEGRIDQEPNISQQFSLWNQLGSSVIRGNLIVVPIGDSFLYVEPIYLESDTNKIPELKRVVVASGNRVAMGERLDEALANLLDLPTGDFVTDERDSSSTTTDASSSSDTPTTVVPIDGSTEELIDAANSAFEAATAAQQAGDWTRYGEELESLQEILRQLDSLGG